MKHALDTLREVSLKLNQKRDEIFELEMKIHQLRQDEKTLVQYWELAIEEVNRKVPETTSN